MPRVRSIGRHVRNHGALYGLIAIGYGIVLFGRFTPQPFREVNTTWATLAWLASLASALQFHVVVPLTVFVVVRTVSSRAWRPALAMVPLVAFVVIAPMLHGTTSRIVCQFSSCRGADPEAPRVMSVNLLVGNHERSRDVAREIIDSEPAVLVLQEYSPAWDRALRSRLRRAGLRRVEAEPREDSFGLAIYARAGVNADTERLAVGVGDAPQYRVEVRVADHRFTVYAVHTLPPVSRAYSIQGRIEFGQLLDYLREDEEPHVLIGDLNATRDSAQHRALARRGYTDAWAERGFGRGATWLPPTLPGFVPGLQLDHLYASRDVRIGFPRLGHANESDHRPLVVRVSARS